MISGDHPFDTCMQLEPYMVLVLMAREYSTLFRHSIKSTGCWRIGIRCRLAMWMTEWVRGPGL